MACIYGLVLLFILSIVCVNSGNINLGSSLSPTSNPAWTSSSGRFAFGFYPENGGFKIGIWLVDNQKNTVVWTANPNSPPVSLNAKLELTKEGELLLITDQGEHNLIDTATGFISTASMLDSGNFVLYSKDNNSNIIWESFLHPTDTILQGQSLFSGGQLMSSVSETNHSVGKFHLKMQDDGNLVLYPLNTGDAPEDAYWNSATFGNGFKFHLHLNSSGQLQIINDTLLNIVQTVNDKTSTNENDDNTIFHATLGSDGIFQLFSHVYDGNGQSRSSLKWSAPENPCSVKGLCGFNSYCTFMDNQPVCLCLDGSDFLDQNQRTLGCQRNYSSAQCKGGEENSRFYAITTMENIVWKDVPYSKEKMSTYECNRSCLEDCNCEAALYQSDYCMKQKLPLRYVSRDMGTQTTTFLKVGQRSLDPQPVILTKTRNAMVKILLLTFILLIFSCVSLTIFGLFINKFRVLRYKRLSENGNLDMIEELTLKFFSYNELIRATDDFKEELGKGSFGAVYKGFLQKGRKPIAVKRLEKLMEEGEREFQAEVKAIGRTHHKNLVRLLGYCIEDSKRLLVYEYMSNGSLANLLFKAAKHPDWDERLKIAVDVSKGILYLHEECESPIIHCDIKPQNILMDEFWTAKISDFGLAKLLMPDQTRTFTGIRGTRGYLAPEWQKNVPISVKADIYSFGIVLLEIISCRKNLETNVTLPDEVLLSTWIYICLKENKLEKIVQGEEIDKNKLERMVKVALWCIQDEPALRPSIKTVILMLEGMIHISDPPCPTASPM